MRTRAEKRARLAAELAKIIETAHELNPLQQAELLGIDVDRVYAHRATARRRGHDLPNLGTPTKYHNAGNWARIEQDAKHRCRRCGLRGDHVCLRGDATDRRAVG